MVFLYEKFVSENEPKKSQNLKKMLRRFPAWNAWATIFKGADIF